MSTSAPTISGSLSIISGWPGETGIVYGARSNLGLWTGF